MPEPNLYLDKRQIQAICGIAVVVLVLTLLVFTYPWLQLQLANRLIQSGNFSQAEQILVRLVDSKPDWTEPRYKLAFSQLYLNKGSDAAATVISLADASRLDDLELAIIFMDVAEYLINTGHGDAALELAKRVLAERRDDDMLNQAVVEIGFQIAQHSDLPLGLEALNTALALSNDNWLLNRKAFNLLLAKALDAPPNLAEPALDTALKLYPNNIIAVTRKASLLGDRIGPKEALNYLVEREPGLLDSLNEEYLITKRALIVRLANSEIEADLTKYTVGMPQSMIVELAKQGLSHARRQGKSGYQYYHMADTEPEVAYLYGQNLVHFKEWEQAKSVFQELQQLAPDYTDYKAVFAAIDSETKTTTEVLQYGGYTPDMAYISPDGSKLALRQWMNHPPTDEFMFSDLVIIDLSSGRRKSMGDAMSFEWSPNGSHLAYLTISPTGLGRLHIYSLDNDSKYTLPGTYDVIDFNWVGEELMVQAERNDGIRLLHLVPSAWRIENELSWDINSTVNHDYAWLAMNKNNLLVHKHRELPREYSLERDIRSFTDWSPNGRLSVIADESGHSWIYDYQDDSLTAVDIPGEFAAWGQGNSIYWYLPVWEKLYVLVRLDSSGNIREYLPYSYSFPGYDLSITADGSATIMVDNNKVLIHRK